MRLHESLLPLGQECMTCSCMQCGNEKVFLFVTGSSGPALTKVQRVPTASQATKYLKKRQEDIRARIGSPEYDNEALAIQQSLTCLTATGPYLQKLQQELHVLDSGMAGGLPSARHKAVRAAVSIASGGMYNPEAVVIAMLPYLQNLAMQLANNGRAALERIAARSVAAAGGIIIRPVAAKVEVCGINDIRANDGRLGRPSAQARRTSLDSTQATVEGHIFIDAGMNFDFDFGLGGDKTIIPNAIGDFNIGEGANEFIHLAISHP